MTNLTPGVRPAFARISTPEEAALLAVRLAEESVTHGSFGVGGFLVDRAGQVVAEATNAVIKDGLVQDPTAHAERQLVDWYCEARNKTLHVPTDEFVIVTSLDPCAMCAGAILRSGLKAIAVAEDPTAGVSEGGMPHRMPRELWHRAEKHFAFFGISGRRPRSGADLGPLFVDTVSPESLARAERAFASSLDGTRNLVGGGNPDVVELKEHNHLSSLNSALPKGTRLPSRNLNVTYSGDRTEIMELLTHDASIIVDRRGQVIMGSAGAEDRSPVRSSVLELIRAYVTVRRLVSEHGLELPHQRHCSIVKRHPPRTPEQALLEFGAVGSFLELPRPSSPLPALACFEWNDTANMERWVASLPPLYTSIIGLSVGSVSPNVSPH